MSGELSGFPEATTPELDRYFHHFHGGSPSETPSHMRNCPEGEECEFEPVMDVAEAVATFGPHDATVDDEMAAIAEAAQVIREHGDHRTAWAMADATGGNHVRAVTHQAGDREAGQ